MIINNLDQIYIAFSISLNIILVLLCIIFLYKNIKSSYNSTNLGLVFCLFCYMFMYGLSSIYTFFNFGVDNHFYISYPVRSYKWMFFSSLLSFISLLFFLISYRSVKLSNIINWTNFYSLNNLKYASLISMFIFIFSSIIYANQYGGFYNAIVYAGKIRGQAEDIEVSAKSGMTFVKYLLPIGIFPAMYFVFKALKSNKVLDVLCSLVFCSYFVFSLFLMGGRSRIIVYCLSFFIISFYLKYKNKLNIKFIMKIITILFITSLFITYGKVLSSRMSDFISSGGDVSVLTENNKANIIDNFLGYFTDKSYSSEVALRDIHENGNVFLFKDAIQFPLYLIPQKITGIIRPYSLSYNNTENLKGYYESEIPPGLVGYGIYNLSLFGVIIVSIFLGGVVSRLDLIANNMDSHYLIYYIPVSMITVLYLFTGDPRIFTSATVFILMFNILLIILSFFRFVSNKL